MSRKTRKVAETRTPSPSAVAERSELMLRNGGKTRRCGRRAGSGALCRSDLGAWSAHVAAGQWTSSSDPSPGDHRARQAGYPVAARLPVSRRHPRHREVLRSVRGDQPVARPPPRDPRGGASRSRGAARADRQGRPTGPVLLGHRAPDRAGQGDREPLVPGGGGPGRRQPSPACLHAALPRPDDGLLDALPPGQRGPARDVGARERPARAGGGRRGEDPRREAPAGHHRGRDQRALADGLPPALGRAPDRVPAGSVGAPPGPRPGLGEASPRPGGQEAPHADLPGERPQDGGGPQGDEAALRPSDPARRGPPRLDPLALRADPQGGVQVHP